MATTNAARHVELDPQRAWELWTNIDRWPTFVEGFSHVREKRGDWPGLGSTLVWESIRGGRGLVTEKVKRSEPGHEFVTQVYERALMGTQTVNVRRTEDGRTRMEIRLDYALTGNRVYNAVLDALFIRRALGQALGRTLDRFAVEAAEEAAL